MSRPLYFRAFLAISLLLVAACPVSADPDAKGMDVEPVLSTKAGQFRALLIGVDDYEKLNDLRCCEADVTAAGDRLVAMGFRRDAIKCLTTGASDSAYRPSYRNITERLDALFSGLKEDAVVVIALSGHGGAFEWKDASGKLQKASFYCPQDARLHDPLRTMVPTKEIYDRMERCPARFKMLLVDACRDKHFAPDETRAAVDEAKSMAGFAKSLSDPSTLPKGTLAMISCASGEQSYEDPKLGHGIFMHYVLEGLSGKADETYRGDRNKMVTYRELEDYVYRKTSDHAWATHEEPQTPRFYAKWELPNFNLAEVQRTGPSQDFTNSIGMKFKLIPAGEFMMGSPDSEENHEDDEGPQHRVKITKSYYLGAYEVTVEDFRTFVEATGYKTDAEKEGWALDTKRVADSLSGKLTPADLKNKIRKENANLDMSCIPEGDRDAMRGFASKCMSWRNPGFAQPMHPVANVSWNDAAAYCKWLSKKEGRTHRLPTEAEWEYACRAGSTTAFTFGEDSSNLGSYAWFDGTAPMTLVRNTHRVGQKRANAWGLYDMHGNVWEWCADRYDLDYYEDSPVNNPTGPSSGLYRVVRGGGWASLAGGCQSTFRFGVLPGYRDGSGGFRIALVPSE